MTFTLGPRSESELAGVHPRLKGLVERAIQLTPQDFCVIQGKRTPAEAEANVQKGVSRTTRSLHLPQLDGWAHAVDLAAWIDGKPAYEPLSAFWQIARAMRVAALERALTVRWGGQWDKPLNVLSADLEHESEAYMRAFRAKYGRAPLADYGHFELPRGVAITTETKA